MNQTTVTIAAGQELVVVAGGFSTVYTAGQTVAVAYSDVLRLFLSGTITSAGLSADQMTGAVEGV